MEQSDHEKRLTAIYAAWREIAAAGHVLSNSAFKLAQDERLDAETRKTLKRQYTEWDEAYRKIEKALF